MAVQVEGSWTGTVQARAAEEVLLLGASWLACLIQRSALPQNPTGLNSIVRTGVWRCSCP